MAAAFVPFLLMGAQALNGALANKSKTNTTSQNTTQKQEQSGSSRPLYDDAQLDVRNFLLRELMGGVDSVPGFEQNYRNQGIAGINQNADRTTNQIRQVMLGRGLGRTSAGIAPEIANENARFGQISQFENNVPLQMEELRRNRLKDFSQFFATLPVGTSQQQSSTSTGNATGTSTTPNNSLAGGLSGLSQMGSFLYGMGAFGKDNSNTNSWGYDMSQPHQPWEYGG